MYQSDLLAEFRNAQELAGFWLNQTNFEQQQWSENLRRRIQKGDTSIKVCLLDSGVNNGHQLLQPLMDNANTLTVNENWGTNDHADGAGHGTLMAGIAGYGKMEDILTTTENILLTHKLCSVKIIPPHTHKQTPKELWGDITSQGISRAEIQNPNVKLIYCMSITSTDGANEGKPSSWSGAIDNLTFGNGEEQRLMIVSAGNVEIEKVQDYPISNINSTVENPAQSWNALTVGAYTEKVQVDDNNYKDYTTVAKKNELSPYSSTSRNWQKRWPVKPDIVFEGGNLLKAPNNTPTMHNDLQLLSTSKSFNIAGAFDIINATSAAAAQASWFAAKIAHQYPSAWVETIRGLMVHSAEWKEAMLKQIDVDRNKKGDFQKLLKTFGYGVPNLEKALHSKESALTYIAQQSIQPFGFDDKNKPKMNEAHFFNLPWPSDLLLEMGEIPVKLKITLSYFIDPGPGEIGWKNRYRYQSHGLRFQINHIGESEVDFKKRIDLALREKENEGTSKYSRKNDWVIGKTSRDYGSIHSDYLEDIAANLSNCNYIAVFPVVGWWREREKLKKVETQTRYSLIVSLDTPYQNVELYTAVKNIINIKTLIEN